MTHSYSAFGLRIDSEVPLDGFTPSGAGPGEGSADICIGQRELGPSSAAVSTHGGLTMEGRLFSESEGVDLRFFLDRGERVYYWPMRDMDPVVLRGFVQGPLLAGALRQRHLLTLHGSAVSDGNGAIIFLGHSGWGKSTLATYFCERGYGLLTDDLMVVEPGTKDSPARVPPGVRQVRLRPAAAEHLVEGYEALPMLDTFSLRHVKVMEGGGQAAVPLDKVYVLEPRSAEANRAVPIGLPLAPMHLVAHTHSMNWIHAPEHISEHLQRCAQLARHTPVATLERKLSLDELPAIFEVICKDLEATREARRSTEPLGDTLNSNR